MVMAASPAPGVTPNSALIAPSLGISCETRQFEAGTSEISPLAYTVLFMNVGGPVRVNCRRDGRCYQIGRAHV